MLVSVDMNALFSDFVVFSSVYFMNNICLSYELNLHYIYFKVSRNFIFIVMYINSVLSCPTGKTEFIIILSFASRCKS